MSVKGTAGDARQPPGTTSDQTEGPAAALRRAASSLPLDAGRRPPRSQVGRRWLYELLDFEHLFSPTGSGNWLESERVRRGNRSGSDLDTETGLGSGLDWDHLATGLGPV